MRGGCSPRLLPGSLRPVAFAEVMEKGSGRQQRSPKMEDVKRRTPRTVLGARRRSESVTERVPCSLSPGVPQGSLPGTAVVWSVSGAQMSLELTEDSTPCMIGNAWQYIQTARCKCVPPILGPSLG